MWQLHGSSLNVTPNNLRSPFLSISFMGSGIGFLVFPLTTISHAFLRFKVIQFSIDQRWVFCTSTKDKSRVLDVIYRDTQSDVASILQEKILVWICGYDVIYHIIEKKSGPNTVTCGTPLLMSTNFVDTSSTTTLCFLLQSTPTLRTPRYYGHQQNPRRKLQTFD